MADRPIKIAIRGTRKRCDSDWTSGLVRVPLTFNTTIDWHGAELPVYSDEIDLGPVKWTVVRRGWTHDHQPVLHVFEEPSRG